MSDQKLSIAWSAKVSPAFVERVISIASNLLMPSDGPDFLMACMAWESGESFSPSIRNGAGSGACVDQETEILTKYGWKKYNEVNIGDPVYSINYVDNKMELDEILHLTIKSSDNNYKMTSRSFDSLTTHDHRWYLQHRFYCRTINDPEISVKTTEEIVNLKSSNRYFIPHPNSELIDKVNVNEKNNLSLYTLIGLIVGDGSINKERRRIELLAHVNGNPGEIELIEECLLDVFPNDVISVDETKSGPGLLRWRFNKEQCNYLLNFFDIEYNFNLNQSKFIKKLNPKIFDDLDFLSAEALLKGYLFSDGHFCNSSNAVSFRNCEKDILNDFMHIAVLCGENPRMVETKREGRLHRFPNGKIYVVRDIYTVYLREARYTSCATHQLKREKVTDSITVWCPTTNNQNWIARRNGTVYITGNCGLIQGMGFVALAYYYNRKVIDKMSADEKKQKGRECCDKLALLTAEEQLDFVEWYFKPYTGKLKTLSDVYSAILFPKAVGKAEDYVLFDKNATPIAYRQNSGVDLNKDGKCTKAEAAQCVTNKLIKGLQPQYRRVIG